MFFVQPASKTQPIAVVITSFFGPHETTNSEKELHCLPVFGQLDCQA